MAPSDPTPGLLYVTMQPKETLPLTQFHDWYNNEHGPTRLRLPFFENGFRYQATDLSGPNTGSQSLPEWMACYDVTDMYELTQEPYMRLRGPPAKSQREIDTMKQIFVDRKLLDLVAEKHKPSEFKALELPENLGLDAEGNVLVAVSQLIDADAKSEVDRWYEEEEIPKLENTAGWRRSRRYVTSHIEPRQDGKVEYLTLHEFAPDIDLDKLDFAKSTRCGVTDTKVRNYKLYYNFGPAPRHLSSITSWTSPDKLTKTLPSSSPEFGSAIESYVTTPDDCVIPYRLEGNSSDPNAPVIVLSNSILVTWAIWDGFLSSFMSNPANHKYRILRYLTRGRTANSGTAPNITIDLLASDIHNLLNCLRIPQAACIIGVSIGGATALATAINYPTRVQSFIACDTSAKSPAGNSSTWGERISVAERDSATAVLTSPFGDLQEDEDTNTSKSAAAEPIVGPTLASQTVHRWFHPSSFSDPTLTSSTALVKHMVTTNSLPGFTRSVRALFDYDYTRHLPTLLLPHQGSKRAAGILVGSGDGALPKSMRALHEVLYPPGSAEAEGEEEEEEESFAIIEGAGHLPMVEKPRDVAAFVDRFLKKKKKKTLA